MIEIAKEYAIKCHESINQKYGEEKHPYLFHLNMAVDFGYEFLYLIPEEDRGYAISGIWIHDVPEDCGETFNDVKKATNQRVAELGYALQNKKGKTRAERANAKYYKGIRDVLYADYDKLCDRLANSLYSYQQLLKLMLENKPFNKCMYVKYKEENIKFAYGLLKPKWYELHQHILCFCFKLASFNFNEGLEKYIEYRKKNHKYASMFERLDSILNK